MNLTIAMRRAAAITVRVDGAEIVGAEVVAVEIVATGKIVAIGKIVQPANREDRENRMINAVPTRNTPNANKRVPKRAKVRNRIRAKINADETDVNAKMVSSKINTIIAYRKVYAHRARIAAKMKNGPTKRASHRRPVNRPRVWINCHRIARCIAPTADAFANRITSEINRANA